MRSKGLETVSYPCFASSQQPSMNSTPTLGLAAWRSCRCLETQSPEALRTGDPKTVMIPSVNPLSTLDPQELREKAQTGLRSASEALTADRKCGVTLRTARKLPVSRKPEPSTVVESKTRKRGGKHVKRANGGERFVLARWNFSRK